MAGLNVVAEADCLSRSFDAPASSASDPQLETDVEEEENAVVNTIFGNLASPVVTIEAVASATSADSVLQSVIEFVVPGWPPSNAEVTSSCRTFYELREDQIGRRSLPASGLPRRNSIVAAKSDAQACP